MKKFKRGYRFFIRPYGESIIESYDDTSGLYICRRLAGSEIFYVKESEIEKG